MVLSLGITELDVARPHVITRSRFPLQLRPGYEDDPAENKQQEAEQTDGQFRWWAGPRTGWSDRKNQR